MKHIFILCALILIVGCDNWYSASFMYECTEEQHDKAITETKEYLALEGNNTRYLEKIYGDALIRNCTKRK